MRVRFPVPQHDMTAGHAAAQYQRWGVGSRRVFVLHLSYFYYAEAWIWKVMALCQVQLLTPPSCCLHFDYHPRAACVEPGSRRRGRVLEGPHALPACLQDWPTRCATEITMACRPAFVNVFRISKHETQKCDHERAKSRPAAGSTLRTSYRIPVTSVMRALH